MSDHTGVGANVPHAVLLKRAEENPIIQSVNIRRGLKQSRDVPYHLKAGTPVMSKDVGGEV